MPTVIDGMISSFSLVSFYYTIGIKAKVRKKELDPFMFSLFHFILIIGTKVKRCYVDNLLIDFVYVFT